MCERGRAFEQLLRVIECTNFATLLNDGRAIPYKKAFDLVCAPRVRLPAGHPVGWEFEALGVFEHELNGEVAVGSGMQDQFMFWDDEVPSDDYQVMTEGGVSSTRVDRGNETSIASDDAAAGVQASGNAGVVTCAVASNVGAGMGSVSSAHASGIVVGSTGGGRGVHGNGGRFADNGGNFQLCTCASSFARPERIRFRSVCLTESTSNASVMSVSIFTSRLALFVLLFVCCLLSAVSLLYEFFRYFKVLT